MPGARDRLGPGASEPGELGRVHLGRDPAAHIAQHRVGAGVDPFRVACGAMIHPHDHVALGRAGWAHRQGMPIAVERDQRAGRVEAHAANSLGLKPRRLDRLTHRRRRRAPDVVGRLLDDLARLAPDGDRAPRAGDERAGGIEHAGPGAERADVHSDKRLAHTLLPGVKSAGGLSVSGAAGKRKREAGGARRRRRPGGLDRTAGYSIDQKEKKIIPL